MSDSERWLSEGDVTVANLESLLFDVESRAELLVDLDGVRVHLDQVEVTKDGNVVFYPMMSGKPKAVMYDFVYNPPDDNDKDEVGWWRLNVREGNVVIHRVIYGYRDDPIVDLLSAARVELAEGVTVKVRRDGENGLCEYAFGSKPGTDDGNS